MSLLRKVIPANHWIRKMYRGYKELMPEKIGIGIDLGVKELAVLSNGMVFPSINKGKEIMALKKGLANASNRQVKKTEKQMDEIRFKYIDHVISKIVGLKPKYITIEDLHFNFTEASCKSNSLHKAIRDQHFEYFKKQLIKACRTNGIPLRMVPSNYPSSKTCSKCGYINTKLTLADRTYKCKRCGFKCNRDLNAAYNLRKARKYKRIA